jgi:carbon monoxide dehydrogenase subunit G
MLTLTVRFAVRAPIETTWRALLDVPGIVHCLPGVELTEVLSDRSYAGRAELKLGPFHRSYRGLVQIVEADDDNHTVRMSARRADGGGAAAGATVRARLVEDGGGTSVVMETEIVESGLVARLGAKRMIQTAAQRMSERFAGCLERQLSPSPG